MTFEIKGEVPSKKNSRINTRSGRSFPNKKYVEWHKNAISQIPVTETFCEPVYIKLCFYHGDNRRRDSDNGVSSVFDTLVDANVIPDDRWQIVKKHEVENDIDKENPRVEVTIMAYNDYVI